MIEHRLYGVRVVCDFALFDRPTPVSAVAPGEHSALQLRQAGTGSSAPPPPESLAESMPLYSTHGRELFLRTDREAARSAAGQPWCLQVEGLASFSWTGGDPVIHYQLGDQGNRALLVFWFVHIFLPLHLTLERGWDFIHAAAVEVDERPILFIAPSMGGKSTLGDYFLQQGHPMLSDDKVATFLEQLLPNYLFSFRFLQEQCLRWLAQLADQSLIYRVRRPWNLARMHETYDAICAHTRERVE